MQLFIKLILNQILNRPIEAFGDRAGVGKTLTTYVKEVRNSAWL